MQETIAGQLVTVQPVQHMSHTQPSDSTSRKSHFGDDVTQPRPSVEQVTHHRYNLNWIKDFWLVGKATFDWELVQHTTCLPRLF